jgi:molecular chaperone GrpE
MTDETEQKVDAALQPEPEPAEAATGQTAPTADLEQPALAAAVEERDRYRELALRSQADFENYQKRVARDQEQTRKYATQALVGDLLLVVDDLERALDSAKGQNDSAAIFSGLEIVHKHFTDVLARHGVTPLVPIGEVFDPTQHEALMQQPSPDHEPMTVLHVLRKGYTLHDRVVRPAQVVVAAGPPTSSDTERTSGGQESS